MQSPEESGRQATVIAQGVDDEVIESNRREYGARVAKVVVGFAVIYAAVHMLALNGVSISGMTGGLIDPSFLPTFPIETWNFRISHVAGALALGFLLFGVRSFVDQKEFVQSKSVQVIALVLLLSAIFSAAAAFYFAWQIHNGVMWQGLDPEIKSNEIWLFGTPLWIAVFGALFLSLFDYTPKTKLTMVDLVLAISAVSVAVYLITIYGTLMRNSTGTPFAPIGISMAAVAGTALILELTRRVAGLALVVIACVFLVYVFVGEHLPGFLSSPPITWERFFSQVYTDAGVLGPTTAVSSTYIILFIIFAAFLQASKVGDYFVNFAFALAGKARGGPAKVAIFASGLMGMINGTSAGNVVATGSLTIPLMKRVGYGKQTAGAIEAAASTGGQIMPPIMGAGAFIMAEVTGIPYSDIAIAAIIPAVLYFVSIYFMVDFEAAKLGMRGMNDDEIPKFRDMVRQIFLFIPIIILIVALFMGYSVIRAGTLATVSAAVVSWFTPYRMDLRGILKAFELAGSMSIQIIAVCACAGIIVGVISLTGVGARFSSLLLGLAEASQLLALFFAMCIAILLGMGMPTTAAYAVAASVVAPGLVNLGIPLLTAHFFVFYFAVVSAITPPVALASFAAAGISGANPLETSVASFKIGIAAFVVPFMFFYNSTLLMEGPLLEVVIAFLTATGGIFLLACAVQGWFLGNHSTWFVRIALVVASLFMISGSLKTDAIGIALAVITYAVHRFVCAQKFTNH